MQHMMACIASHTLLSCGLFAFVGPAVSWAARETPHEPVQWHGEQQLQQQQQPHFGMSALAHLFVALWYNASAALPS